MRSIANTLSLLRLASVVPMALFAWAGYAGAFLALVVVAVLTDAVDGWFARRATPEKAQLGAQLDSAADYALYVAVPLSAWWLWPEIAAREAFWIGAVCLSYALPGALALARFGRPAAFHTWAAKAAVAIVTPSLLVLFAGGPAWPLRISAVIALFAGLEQCAMIRMAPGPHEEVRSLWHARRLWQNHTL